MNTNQYWEAELGFNKEDNKTLRQLHRDRGLVNPSHLGKLQNVSAQAQGRAAAAKDIGPPGCLGPDYRLATWALTPLAGLVIFLFEQM